MFIQFRHIITYKKDRPYTVPHLTKLTGTKAD